MLIRRGFLNKASGGTITGDVEYEGSVTDSNHITTKTYVDAAVAGLSTDAQYDNVYAASTGDLTLSGEQTIDGVLVQAGRRLLVKDQTPDSENGIYVVDSGAWSRSSDLDETSEAAKGSWVIVENGTTNGGTGWYIKYDPGDIDVDSMIWAQFAGETGTALEYLPLSGGTITPTDDSVPLLIDTTATNYPAAESACFEIDYDDPAGVIDPFELQFGYLRANDQIDIIKYVSSAESVGDRRQGQVAQDVI